MVYLFLPLLFLRYWFIDLPIGMILWTLSFNKAFLQLLSFPLLVRTFFKPLKNEYRKGLVGFSLAMGIVVKTVLIFVDLLLFIVVLSLELLVIIGFLVLPFLALLLLFHHL